MMGPYQPSNWGRRIAGVGLLLLGIAAMARVIYELLAPLLPLALVLLIVGVLYLATVHRWQR